MRPMIRIYLLDDKGQRVFGEGPYQLLLALEETGSLRGAAQSMGMAYTKALKILKRAEAALGCPLTCRQTGGKDGGGSQLTPQGRALLEQYSVYRTRCAQANRRIYEEVFPNER